MHARLIIQCGTVSGSLGEQLGETKSSREERKGRRSGNGGGNGNLARRVSYFSPFPVHRAYITPLRSTVISPRRFYLRRPVTDEDPVPHAGESPSPIKTLPLSVVLLVCISLCSHARGYCSKTAAIHRSLLLVESLLRDDLSRWRENSFGKFK